ncbi:hypothetical protein H6G41_10280 [Tolypothrix sp. FACHB-123]|uniref:DUF6174 domain-containing protein n=1 Tax=Tolypothrix sp. FACHB-123 TaxID=2692868 RepID=UPI0016884342|nr:DUF6174 domain-containing protein [Tolypothrix sp. FACHB-123]MBD2355005.1 hypothetical protein [Tolypothrix sp. FACHB-123]
MSNINKPYLGWVITIALLLGSGIAIFANRTLFLNSSNQELTAARKKWEAQSINHYQVTLNYPNHNCQQEVEIKDNTVIAVKKNTCQTIPLKTITHLFTEIESAVNAEKCGPNGCACDGPVGIDANYDHKYGYPIKFEFKLKPEQRWQYFDYWKNQLSGGYCTLVGFVGHKVEVSSLTTIR